MHTVLRALTWLQKWVFGILDVVIRFVTGLLARILRRGRFRAWRKGV